MQSVRYGSTDVERKGEFGVDPRAKAPADPLQVEDTCFSACPKRLWLEIHRPELQKDSEDTMASFAVGNRVGEVARHVFDPRGMGQLIDVSIEGVDAALARTRELLSSSRPIFEAGFTAAGAMELADILLPVSKKKGKRTWRMIEVKSATRVKDYHREDAAVQAYVARAAGVSLDAIALAYVNKAWVYPGGDDYQGLLREEDVTAEAFPARVRSQGMDRRSCAGAICKAIKSPAIATGKHCTDPFACSFSDYCGSQDRRLSTPCVGFLTSARKC